MVINLRVWCSDIGEHDGPMPVEPNKDIQLPCGNCLICDVPEHVGIVWSDLSRNTFRAVLLDEVTA